MLVLQSLLVGSFICLIAFYVSFRWKRRRLYELAEKIPGPKGLPFIGIAYKFLTVDSKVIFRTLAEVTEEFTSTVKVWLGPELLILADSPDALQVVLNSPHCLDKSSFYDAFLLTKGLVLANGTLWKNHRKILNPAFSVSAVQRLVPKFEEKSKIFVNNLKAKVDKGSFDVLTYMAACSLETILAGALELEKDIQSDPHNNRYIRTIEIGSPMLMKKLINIFHRFKLYHWLTDVYRFEKKHLYGFFLKIADEVLDAKRKKEKIASKVNLQDDGDTSWKPKNFISTLTDPNNGLTHEEMWQEINTLVAAGYETSALAVSHALLLLPPVP